MELIGFRTLFATTGAALLLATAPAFATPITLLYDCDGCKERPLPTHVVFDESTQLFESFTVRWNRVEFDFTFPNLQPALVRQWFWDALNGRPVTPTALPDSGDAQVFPIYWFADTYSPEANACFVFFIGSSGAGPSCVQPPFPDKTVFPSNVGGVARSVPLPEPPSIAWIGLGLASLILARRR